MIFNKIANIRNKIRNKRLDARREKIAKDWSFLTEHDCDCCGSLPDRVDSVSVGWRNPETGEVEILSSNRVGQQHSETKVPVVYGQRLSAVIENKTKEQAQKILDDYLEIINE